MMEADLVVIGAGIVGLATARAALLTQPDLHVVVLDKEGSIAGHQTGRNSGVIHAGVYYKPGSDKARLCTLGRERMVEFCKERDIAHEVCGKLVVAVSPDEEARLADLHQRCVANGVPVEMVGPERMREIEPHVAGVQALHVTVTGIADYPGVCSAFVDDLRAGGADLMLGAELTAVHERGGELVLQTTAGDIEAKRVVNCAGLHADRIARMFGGDEASRGMLIVPFRGEYFELAPSRTHLVKALIYPVPDPQFPFLGVHLTRGVNGHIHAGPNAVLALAREGYSWRAINARDLKETLTFPGFQTLAKAQWRYGLSEMARSFSRTMFADALARLVPEVRKEDLEPAAAGVRAQAIHPDGRLADDFEFGRSNGGRVLHVLN
ncbi:MAG: hypothetical protein RLZZ362_712, partial [Actinomycetota bacterium]